MQAGKLKAILILFLLGMVVVHGAVLWQVRERVLRGYGDFAAFYTAGKLVEQGHARGMYDPHLQWKIQQEFASTVSIRLGPLPYVRPPFEALLFLPFAYLSYPTACVLWMVIKVIVLFAIPFLLRPALTDPRMLPAPLLGLLSLGFFPVGFDLLQGQDSILVLLIFSLALGALQRGAELRSGAFLALALFKFHLVIPIFLVFLLRRKWKFAVGFTGSASFLFLISVWLVGWGGVLAYPKYLWNLNRTSALGMIKPQSMPNLRGLIAGLLKTDWIPDWMTWSLVGLLLLGVVFTARAWRIEHGQDARVATAGFSLAIAVMIVTNYYAYSYDMILLLLPIVWLSGRFLNRSEIDGWPRTVFLICAATLLFSPLYWILIMRLGQFYWMALPLMLLSLALMKTVQHWQSAFPGSES
jgi:Glycosyltransferase family 87